jgi:hypothetical protein
MRDRDDKADFTKRARGLNIEGVPCARYRYVLDRVDVQTRQGRESGEVTLDHFEKWVTVVTVATIAFSEHGRELAVENAGYSKSFVTGRVVPNPNGDGASWVTLQGIYGASSTSARLDQSGNFTLYSVPRGRHLLTVHHGTRVLGVFPVAVKSTGPHELLNVVLPSSSPSELVVDDAN